VAVKRQQLPSLDDVDETFLYVSVQSVNVHRPQRVSRAHETMCFPNRATYRPRYDDDGRAASATTKEQRQEEDASRVKIMRASGDGKPKQEAVSLSRVATLQRRGIFGITPLLWFRHPAD